MDAKDFQWYCTDGKMPEKVSRQVQAEGEPNPKQRPGLTTTDAALDYSQMKWDTEGKACYPEVRELADYAPKQLRPMMTRVDKEYVKHYSGYAGAASTPGSAGTCSLRVIACCNGMPVVDIDTPERRVFLRTDAGFAMLLREFPLPQENNADAAQFNPQAREDRIVKHFEAEKAKCMLRYQGQTHDSQPTVVEVNNIFAVAFNGQQTTCNTSTQQLYAGDYIAFTQPIPGKELVLGPDNKWMFWMTTKKQDKKAPVVIDRCIPFVTRFVRDPLKMPYHARVTQGAGPGQQLTIQILPEGECASLTDAMYR